MNRRAWTPAEVIALGVRTDVPTAGEIIAGLCRDESYRMVQRGEFPVPVLKVGRRLVVPVAPIRQLLGIGSPEREDDKTGPASVAAVDSKTLTASK